MASTTGIISSPGIGSNLDVNTIVGELMAIESQPLQNIQMQQAQLNANLSAWGQLNSAFASFTQSITAATQAATFQAMQATPSNTSVLTATASTTAQAGSHTLTVSTLAQAQSLSSADFTDPSTVVGAGSLTIQFGTYNSGANAFTANPATPAKTVTIDSAHDTLSGVMDAINAANAGVTASIINDGTGNRLVITSNSTGTANSLKITAADSSGNPLTLNTAGQLGQLAYDPTVAPGSGQNLSQSLAAKDATFTLDGINIVKSSNTVTDVLSGVTLNLAGSGTSTVTIGQNDTSVKSAIQNFVAAYNSLWNALNSYTGYNSTTQSGGQLNGDPTATSMQRALPRILTGSIPGWDGTLKSLTDIGVKLQKDGTLAIEDPGTLDSALQAHYNDVAGLFATVGSTSDSQVSYAASTADTQPGTYAVAVTQLATQGAAAGTQSLSGGAQVQAGTNDSLTVDLDGVTATVTLVPGSYTAAQLAAQVQAQINGTSTFKTQGLGVTVTVNGVGGLTITSNSYGSLSKVQLTGDAVTSLFGTPAQTAGTDVAGTINGIAATGSGQFLTAQTPAGASKNAAQGLGVKVTGGAIGDRGTVSFSQGVATQFLTYANSVTDAQTGLIINRENGINQSLATLNTRMDQENVHLAAVKSAYMAQFTALDTLLGSMTATSGFLTQQLGSLPWASAGASTNAQKNGG